MHGSYQLSVNIQTPRIHGGPVDEHADCAPPDGSPSGSSQILNQNTQKSCKHPLVGRCGVTLRWEGRATHTEKRVEERSSAAAAEQKSEHAGPELLKVHTQ